MRKIKRAFTYGFLASTAALMVLIGGTQVLALSGAATNTPVQNTFITH